MNLQDACTAGHDLLRDLNSAVLAANDEATITAAAALSETLTIALDCPSELTQSLANAIGEQMREVDGLAASDEASANAAQALHDHLAQSFVDHFDSTLDWDDVAGNGTAGKGGAHTNSGTKTKPPTSGDPGDDGNGG